MKFKAVIFDLDGTLADSIPDIAGAANHILKTYGFPARAADEYVPMIGEGLAKLLERVLPPDAKLSDSLDTIRGLWLDYYGEHCLDNTRAYDGMAQSVAELKRRGLKLGVATNKQERIAVKIVEGLYGAGAFSVIRGMGGGVPHKPDPTIVNGILSVFGATGGECLFVGDSKTDVETALNAGCVPAGALWGYRAADELRRAGAKYLLRHPSELPGVCS